MIVQTVFRLEEDGWDLVRTYSSRGVKIMQDGTGEIYAEAIDPEFMHRTYTETEIPIEPNTINEENAEEEEEIIPME